jgi:hypothetical protein
MGGANGSRECAPDDELRDTHRVDPRAKHADGFRKRSTHAAGSRDFKNVKQRATRARLRVLAACPHEVCFSCPLESEGAGNAGCAMHP